MANIAKCARATAVMNKVKGKDPFAFTRRFIGYNEATEGIMAQQREADLKFANKKANYKWVGFKPLRQLRHD